MEAMTESGKGAVDLIGRLGVLPVVEVPTADAAAPLAEALIAGGMPAAEITLRTEAGLEALRTMRRLQPDMLVGAGTVRTVEDAKRVVDAGAQFIVSPGTNPEVNEYACAQGVPVLSGACTPTEVDLALRSGASAVKFFPAEAMGGIPVLKALAGPFRDVSFVPTGGVKPENLADYLSLPNVLGCGGTWITGGSLIADGRFDRIEQFAREAVSIVAEARNV
jgi:2-dehydro-3-deoxyphosphogluconate aldolase/(4S)-4-hydroxy-2-oxoglutarate aldolase